MVVENTNFNANSFSGRNESGRGASHSTVRSSKCRVVSGCFRGYPYTDGIKDGRAYDFVNKIIKERSIDILLP